MLRKAILVGLAAVIAIALALALYARSVLASDNVRATLESQLTDWFGQPVTIGRAGASIFPRVAVQLHDVAIGKPAIITISTASLSTGLQGLFSRRIEEAEVVLTDGRVRLPDALKLRVAADDAASADAPAEGGGAIALASVRVISLKNVEFTTGTTSMRFDMESALAGDRLEITKLSGKSARTELDATGALTSISTLQGALTVKASTLDLDELIALSSGFTAPVDGAPAASAGASPMRITLDITAESGVLAGHAFSDLATKLDATPARVRLNPFSLQTYGGALAGTLDVDTSPPAPVSTLKGKVSGIDVASLASAAGMGGSITGTLGGTVTLVARGTDPDALMKTTRGSASAVIADGVIPGLEMVREIVLAFGKPSGAPPAGSGSAFTRLGGDFAIQDGTIHTDNLAFASRDFDMAGRASLTVPAGGLDATVNVILSKELTQQAGTDLRRYAQDDGRIIIPARITGTIGAPSIALDVAAAAERALQNELKRRAKGLLDDLFRRKKGGS